MRQAVREIFVLYKSAFDENIVSTRGDIFTLRCKCIQFRNVVFLV